MIHLESEKTVRVVETHHAEVLVPNSAQGSIAISDHRLV
jgi:hypothetical protein